MASGDDQKLQTIMTLVDTQSGSPQCGSAQTRIVEVSIMLSPKAYCVVHPMYKQPSIFAYALHFAKMIPRQHTRN